MGGFAIIRRDPGCDGKIARATAAFATRGFSNVRRWDYAGHTILLAPKLVSPAENHSETADGFAAITGTAFYRGGSGKPALRALLADARAGRIDERALLGCYAAIVATPQDLRLFIDGLGTYKVYHSRDRTVWSSSFLVCLATVDRPKFDRQGVYEYVFQGATYGGDSVIAEIAIAGPHHRYRLAPDARDEPRALPLRAAAIDPAPMEVHVTKALAQLRPFFQAIAAAYGDQVDTALSGGYDSRLTLALLREQGVMPRIHVYGRADDPDVTVAKAIAAGEGFDLKHEDKSGLGDNSPEGVAKAVDAQFRAFDGCPPDGIIGNGADFATRTLRTVGGVLALNGGGGEIFRNFFYLPGGSYSASDMVRTFYSQFDPAAATRLFDEERHQQAMARKIGAIFDPPRAILTRAEVEFIYPGFRGRFWTGLNTSLNTHLGPALTPFFEAALVDEALRVPLAFKNHGVFEAAIIAAIDPRLAAYPSAYGHGFTEAPPLGRRAADWLTYVRPPALRRLTYRVKKKLRSPSLPRSMTQEYRKHYLPDGTPAMARFFRMDAAFDGDQMGRILTLEYLAGQYSVAPE